MSDFHETFEGDVDPRSYAVTPLTNTTGVPLYQFELSGVRPSSERGAGRCVKCQADETESEAIRDGQTGSSLTDSSPIFPQPSDGPEYHAELSFWKETGGGVKSCRICGGSVVDVDHGWIANSLLGKFYMCPRHMEEAVIFHTDNVGYVYVGKDGQRVVLGPYPYESWQAD